MVEELDADELDFFSLIANHPFDTGREAMLEFFSPTMQQSLSSPTSSASSLYLHIVGLLFTRIDLDQVRPNLGRFIERLELDHFAVAEHEWVMMAILGIGSILEFGKADAKVRKAGGLAGGDKSQSQVNNQGDESRPGPAVTSWVEVLSLAFEVTFTTLNHILSKNPFMPLNPAFKQSPVLNPYVTVILTFLSTLFKSPTVIQLMERDIPWQSLSALSTASFQQSSSRPRPPSSRDAGKLSAGHLIPEDWCLRGMEWAGRRVYERGFWRSKSPIPSVQSEMDVIRPGEASSDEPKTSEHQDGVVEDERGDEMEWEASPAPPQVLSAARWKRVRTTAEVLLKSVPGFGWDDQNKRVIVHGELEAKIARWEEGRRKEEEEVLARSRGHKRVASSSDNMEVEEDEPDGDDVDDENDEDPEDSEQVKELKVNFPLLSLSWRRELICGDLGSTPLSS